MINVIFNQFDYEISQRKQEMWDRYLKVIQWGRRNPVKFMELIFGLSFTDHQRYVLLSTWNTRFAVWLMSRNSGKSLALDTPVYASIPNRSNRPVKKTIGDLNVGDKIYDESGNLTEVIHLNSIIFEDCYEVEFEDGDVIKCNKEHLWAVYDKNFDKRREGRNLILRNTEFLYDNFVLKRNDGYKEYRFHVPMNAPIQYPNYQKLKVNPYLLGVWLGDGSKGAPTITQGIQDAEEMCNILENMGCVVDKKQSEKRKDIFSISIDTIKKIREENDISFLEAKDLSFKQRLKDLGILDNKRIPEDYFYATVDDRLLLLQGIMDTDGYIDKGGHCELSQSADHLDLLKDISRLLTSLGIKNNIHHKTATCKGKKFDAYRINFRTDKTMPCFKLKRKYDRLPDESTHIVKTKAIKDIRKTNQKVAMRCITVSNDTGLFLCGDKMTVTHNSYLSAPYMMARSILIPNHKSYIMCPSGSQAKQTFMKIEDLSKGKIASARGSTGVFLGELVRANAGVDAFVHDKLSYHCELYNGSTITTLNSIAKNAVGIRSNLNFYDEAGE